MIVLVHRPVKFSGHAGAVGHPEKVTRSVGSIGILRPPGVQILWLRSPVLCGWDKFYRWIIVGFLGPKYDIPCPV